MPGGSARPPRGGSSNHAQSTASAGGAGLAAPHFSSIAEEGSKEVTVEPQNCMNGGGPTVKQLLAQQQQHQRRIETIEEELDAELSQRNLAAEGRRGGSGIARQEDSFGRNSGGFSRNEFSPAGNVMHFHAFSELVLGGGGFKGSSGGDMEEEAFSLALTEIGGAQRTAQITVYPFHDVELVKRLLLRVLRLQRTHKISDVELFYNGLEVPNRRLLTSFASDDLVQMTWRIKEKITKGAAVRGIRERGGVKLHPALQAVMEDVVMALQRKINPRLTMEGTGATYILSNVMNRPVGVFKPHDEEAFAPNNPRGYTGKLGQPGFRAGVVSGEGATREVAAFLLDAFYGSLSGVPVTAQVEMIHPHFCYDPDDPRSTRHGGGGDEDLAGLLSTGGLVFRKKKTGALNDNRNSKEKEGPVMHWKTGSLQEFVNAKESSSDFDPKLFSVGDVHRIAILDVRLANMDRNDGNILVVRADEAEVSRMNPQLLRPIFIEEHPEYEQRAMLTMDGKPAKYRLIPIDHGLTLPDCLDITDFDLAWLNWPQAHVPFLPEELEYIKNLKPDKDAEWLENKLGIRRPCLRVMQVTTRLLKKGAKADLTLHQIAMLMVRVSPDEPSPLEKAIRLAVSQACFASYAISLVHKREFKMKYAMDLAGPSDMAAARKIVGQKANKIGCLPGLDDEDFGDNDDPDSPKGGGLGHHQAFVDELAAERSSGNSPLVTETAPSILASDGGMAGLHNGTRPRSKTMGRMSAAAATHQKTTQMRLAKNFTNWRENGDSTSLSSLWTAVDLAGRIVTPDWFDPKFERLFFEALGTMLEFLTKEKASKSKSNRHHHHHSSSHQSHSLERLDGDTRDCRPEGDPCQGSSLGCLPCSSPSRPTNSALPSSQPSSQDRLSSLRPGE